MDFKESQPNAYLQVLQEANTKKALENLERITYQLFEDSEKFLKDRRF